jgi:hypothetical protein
VGPNLDVTLPIAVDAPASVRQAAKQLQSAESSAAWATLTLDARAQDVATLQAGIALTTDAAVKQMLQQRVDQLASQK